MDNFAHSVDDITPEQLSQECGVDYGPTLQLLNQLRQHTSILIDSSFRSLELMSCKNMVPLYTNAVYEGACDYNIRGVAWIFACFVVISFFGMLMIMFRGAYYPIWYEEDGKSLEYATSDDELELQEEESGEEGSEYVEESMVETAAEEGATLEEGEYEEEEYEESAYEEGSQYTEEVSQT